MNTKSVMVWATKYQLLVPKSIKEGVYDENGPKEKIHSKLVTRAFVEDRNSQSNNELYIIDEKKTAELMKERDANVIANAKQKQRESLTQADLIDAMVTAVSGKAPVQPEPTKEVEQVIEEPVKEEVTDGQRFENMTLEELQAYCDEKGIEYHHAMKEGRLIEVIKNA
jgi:hypothetical protein